MFISYSRKGGGTFAADLRDKFLRQRLSVWQDIIALEVDGDWWSEVEGAIRSSLARTLQHFLLVVTPGALESPVVRRETRLACQEGTTVSPVKGPGLGDLAKLPRSSARDKAIRLWDVDTSRESARLEGHSGRPAPR
jgi:hypothetical protein